MSTYGQQLVRNAALRDSLEDIRARASQEATRVSEAGKPVPHGVVCCLLLLIEAMAAAAIAADGGKP